MLHQVYFLVKTVTPNFFDDTYKPVTPSSDNIVRMHSSSGFR